MTDKIFTQDGMTAAASGRRWFVSLGGMEAAAVIAGAGLALLISVAALPKPISFFVCASFIFAMLAWIVAADWRHWVVPDGAAAAVALAGAGFRLSPSEFAGDPSALVAVLFDGAVWGGAFWLLRETYFRCRGVDGLGFGDVKLAAAGGVLTGMAGFAWALLAASIFGLAVAGIAGLRGEWPEKLPFGALLAPALCVAWLAQALS